MACVETTRTGAPSMAVSCTTMRLCAVRLHPAGLPAYTVCRARDPC
jgi:hypothetical protein